MSSGDAGSRPGGIDPGLVPLPRSAEVRGTGRGFALDERTVLEAAPGTEGTALWLRSVLGAAYALQLPPGPAGGGGPGVRLVLDDALEPEAHRLDVDPVTGVEIRGGGPAGVFWGAQTLRQLLGPDAFRRAPVRPGVTAVVPAVRVEDAPRFRWRGLLLDVARHFMPKDGVLRIVDLMAGHKLNVLHLHLTDDQGWRIEIRRHPRLTEVGAWRPRTKLGHRASPLWDERPHGGYYTQDDLREIVAYAAARHVTVVPEIDIPGHSQAAIAAHPELGNTDAVDTAALGVWDTWGISPHVLAPTDRVVRFYEEVLEEVLEIFPAPFVHLGGDECPKEEWRASATAQARIRELGVGDEDGLQAWFTAHFARWLAGRGRRMVGWDEILDGGRPLPEGTVVSSWRGYQGGVAAAGAGHEVVVCPEQHVYLDHRQAPGDGEPVPLGFVRTVEDVHGFEPVPKELDAYRERVLGVQANLWTEVVEDGRRADYQLFPRLAAFAEVAWSSGRRGFPARLDTHLSRLDALGVEYRPLTGPHPWQQRPGLLGRPLPGP
ncbi:beta-N-acetylhexosaminidase [Streptomyces sp. UH6]|uniref:beta-N-acetylhexosaminidase n=1 Tax=Streptomyces sp. UH6 TaxID=2748379 RepID=UPI00280BD972|nr:beta-N-acetylhexosaminidase [Streptomyces sp. UH6]